ncbi:MAG: thioredoxin domain-containing protein [Dehalococcoidia bacterium]|nr:thioredoxin domain-containing protein [Dehalococcoidia bacterium]
MPNRLANETSPYLLQHKDNPVDWYPWSDEALSAARLLDKPILLSIGYSSCHWCHVMAHESFENESIASIMNANFINIKVDREELPDVDSIYMTAVQAMTGSGGWPLTVFITPDGQPFFGGTYFPPEDRPHMAGFPRVLDAISDAYANKRKEIIDNSQQIVATIREQSTPQKNDGSVEESLIFGSFTHLVSNADLENGGMQGAPKFPQPMIYELLLRYWKRTGSSQALDTVTLTLEKMAHGGIYDQIGGGFARYSVDDKWLVPHFEKMLYDNALLVSLYLHAYQATKKPLFKRIVEETLEYITREMTHSAGGFYSASDADSEGVEGKFFVWTSDEIDTVLSESDSEFAKAYWGVTKAGNFEGANILNLPISQENLLTRSERVSSEIIEQVARIRSRLLEARSKRIAPGIDDKILVSWNALMLKAFAESGAVFENPEWIAIAKKNAHLLLDQVKNSEGLLLHTWKATSATEGDARIFGYLDDHSYLIDALLSLYEATFDYSYVNEAQSIANQMIDRFWDVDLEVFYDTSLEHTKLLVRPRDVLDNALPSGGAIAAIALQRLSRFTGEEDYIAKAEASMKPLIPHMEQAPSSVTSWLAAVDLLRSNAQEVVLVGDEADPVISGMKRELWAEFAPNTVLAGLHSVPDGSERSPLLKGRSQVNGKATAFVCENYACKLPVTSVAELIEQLG